MYTLAQPFVREGIGLHSGQVCRVSVYPEPIADRGRYFVRVDLADRPEIPARFSQVQATMLATELVATVVTDRADRTDQPETSAIKPNQCQISVRTVEHLLAALVGLGVSAARIEIDGPEVPLLDGSAREWCAAIAQAGLTAIDPGHHVQPSPIREALWVRDGDSFVAALPSPILRFSYGIEFAEPAIGNQWHSWSAEQTGFSPLLNSPTWPEPGSFAAELAPARTFGLAHQVEQLRAAGLIRGGSLDNALVCSAEGWLNPPLRFPNEPARHKILDLVGDLSLLGEIPTAHYCAFKASHRLHGQLATLIATHQAAQPAAKQPIAAWVEPRVSL